MVQAKVEKAPGVLGRFSACSTERIEVLSSKMLCNHPLRYTPSFLYLESSCDENWRKPYIRKYMCHLDHRRRFPTKLIGWMNWIQKSLKAAKRPNESNQNQKPNYQERETRRWARVHKGNRERYLVWSRGRQALNKNGETRMWIRIHTKLRVDAY